MSSIHTVWDSHWWAWGNSVLAGHRPVPTMAATRRTSKKAGIHGGGDATIGSVDTSAVPRPSLVRRSYVEKGVGRGALGSHVGVFDPVTDAPSVDPPAHRPMHYQGEWSAASSVRAARTLMWDSGRIASRLPKRVLLNHHHRSPPTHVRTAHLPYTVGIGSGLHYRGETRPRRRLSSEESSTPIEGMTAARSERRVSWVASGSEGDKHVGLLDADPVVAQSMSAENRPHARHSIGDRSDFLLGTSFKAQWASSEARIEYPEPRKARGVERQVQEKLGVGVRVSNAHTCLQARCSSLASSQSSLASIFTCVCLPVATPQALPFRVFRDSVTSV
jgi:hypothetical protein